MPKLEFHEVDAARWGDFERLFKSPEVARNPAGAWFGEQVRKPIRAWIANLRYVGTVSNETPIGLLGYSEGEPVAWCSIAPRPTYRIWRPEPGWRITRTSMVAGLLLHSSRLAWTGLTKQIIEAAVRHAEKRGATVIEAYPVDPSSPSYRFMGYVQTFISAGFYEVGRAGTRRHVLRRELRN